MTDQVDAFPLCWPQHIARTEPSRRAWGGFQVTPDIATQELVKEVKRSGGRNLIISTNRPVRQDGLPRAAAREPDDPGVAVYFERKGKRICIPCDTYDRVWKNIRAIGLSIGDMRRPEARGCTQITDQAFTAFVALPPPGDKPWFEVLRVSPDAGPKEINEAYRKLARDLANRGDEIQLRELNVAREQAMEMVQ